MHGGVNPRLSSILEATKMDEGLAWPNGNESDRTEIREECGVFGVHGVDDAARFCYYGLQALQHRGQESAGIATQKVDELAVKRGMGLVSDVFHEEALAELQGQNAIGHVRYSTLEDNDVANAQPLLFRYRQGQVALAHNGSLVNAHPIRRQLEEEGSIFQTNSDTEVIAHLMARSGYESIPDALDWSLHQVQGGYALLILAPGLLVAARDPHGIRPLCLGRLDESYIVASESCAFDATGARFIREVEPGEMLIIDRQGLRSRFYVDDPEPAPGRLCIFEFVYFSRPDSHHSGRNVHLARKQMGRFLAQDHPVDADVVIGVPDSSISSASGYAEEAQIPYEIGLIKNRYVGRTFIRPSPTARAMGVRIKLNAVRQVVEGKRVVLVDDSIVRGTTSMHLIQLVRDAGAKEVHMRISSPPYVNPCHYGIDTADREQLLATEHSTVEAMREAIGADSLAFLSIERLTEAVGGRVDQYCTACFTGDYPVPVPESSSGRAIKRRQKR